MMSIDWRDARVQCWYALIGRLIPIYLKKSVRSYPPGMPVPKGGGTGWSNSPMKSMSYARACIPRTPAYNSLHGHRECITARCPGRNGAIPHLTECDL